MKDKWVKIADCDGLTLRSLFGSFMTGVTVVATRTELGDVRAITANSFTSVSLDPPLVLLCLAKSSLSVDVFTNCRSFSISILGEGQRDVSSSFASRDPIAKVAALGKLVGQSTPYVSGSIACIMCEQYNVVDAGDHLILIGRVLEFRAEDGQPLGFFRGSYVNIGASIRELEQVETQLVVGAVIDCSGKVVLCRNPDSKTWEIPTAFVSRGERHGGALDRLFSGLGIMADARLPYSLFQEFNESSTTLIFSSEAIAPVAAGMRPNGLELGLFGVDDEPWKLVNGEMKRGVVQRYFHERGEGLFGIYFDTVSGGRVVSLGMEKKYWEQ